VATPTGEFEFQLARYKQAVASLDSVQSDGDKHAAIGECMHEWSLLKALLAERTGGASRAPD
jgi:hypothetical protein